MADFSRQMIQFPGAPPQENELTEKVVSRTVQYEEGIGKDFRIKCQRYYRQYRGFRQWRDAWVRSGPNDRDGFVYDAHKHWGAHLHIPLSFRTIETIVPRAIAQMPHLLVLPRDEEYEENVVPVKMLLDAQQEQIDIDLPFQAVMRAGRIYGLGVGKTYWRKEVINKRRVVPRAFVPGFKVSKDLEPHVLFDDPTFEDVDVFDWMWDPYGSSMDTIEWCVHRIWMSTEAVMNRLASGAWNTTSAKMLDEDKVKSMTSQGVRYDEIWTDRMLASGFNSFHLTMRGEQPHEVLEYHDGERVITALDRQVLVQEAENPTCGVMPFQIYRPTPLQKQMVGIGDLEPLEHLQRELDTLRSQRRDAATIALCAGYAFDEGAVNEEDLVFGPAAAIRVTNARPQDAIMPLTVKDVPGSGYQEESVIRSDFEAVSGIADALDNSPGGASSTATEAQLVQAALGRRIELGSRRFEIEVVRHVARTFLYLDQRMILEPRAPMRVPGEGLTVEEAMEAGKWRWFQIGPNELRGEFEVVPEGGSLAARNLPQDRSDAAAFMNMFTHSWYLNPTKVILKSLKLMGIKHPESWLREPEPPIPQGALRILELAGVDPALIQQAVIRARTISAPQEGPSGEAAMAPGAGQQGTAPPMMGAPR